MATEITTQGTILEKFRTSLTDSTNLLIFGIMASIGMLIIPLPIIFLDFFQIFNIILSLIVMITVVNTRTVLDFSTFPIILLFTTIFRLSVNVSSTRLILMQGESFDGQVINTFVNFVVGGNYIVGFVVFLVITAVMFIVITKGSTRVSEVSARFQLDAMPQKQLAIDTELSQGLINEEQASKKRELIQQEASFYGNMDGASKFVSGDIKVGLVITIINILGGIVIGTFLRGETFISAIENYVMLSIGDGLVAQIPSLLISTASGIIVTKNISENSLGDNVKEQMFNDPTTMYIVAFFIFSLSFVPGFPSVLFMTTSLIFVLFGYSIQKSFITKKEKDRVDKEREVENKKKEKEEDYYDPSKMGELLYVDPLELEIGYSLIPLVDEKSGGDLLDRIKKMRKQIVMDLGLIVPQVRLTDNMKLGAEEYEIKIQGTKIGGGELRVDKLMALPQGDDEKIEGEKTIEPVFHLPAYWVDESQKDELEIRGANIFDCSTIVATHLTELVKRHAGEILSRKNVQDILDGVSSRNTSLMDELKKTSIKNGEIQKVLQQLLVEGISIRNIDMIIEGICDNYVPGMDVGVIYEAVRYGLRRQISDLYSDENSKVNAMVFSGEIENELNSMVVSTDKGYALNIAPDLHQKLIETIGGKIENMRKNGFNEIIVVDRMLRFPMKKLLQGAFPYISVLSYIEIADTYKLEIVETI